MCFLTLYQQIAFIKEGEYLPAYFSQFDIVPFD